MIWGIAVVIGLAWVDTLFISRLGTLQLAALGFAFPVVMVVNGLAMGLGIGASSVIARAIGRGDRERAGRLATDAMLLAVLTSLLLLGVGIASIEPLFSLLGAKAGLLPLLREYMAIWYLGMGFLVIPMVGNSILRAAGDAKTPSLIMTVAAVVNVALDPLLIFGWLGWPRWELNGAAVAAVAARGLAMLLSFHALAFRLRILAPLAWRLASQRDSFAAILHVGLPAAGTAMLGPLSGMVLVWILSQSGEKAVAAFGVASRTENLAMVVFIGLAAGAAPFIGQNQGAGLWGRVEEARRATVRFSLAWGVLTAVLFAFFGEAVAALFDPDPEVRHLTALYLAIVPWSYPAAGLILTGSSALNALGAPYQATLISLTRALLLNLPLAWLGSLWMGATGVFAAVATGNLLVGVWSWRLVRKRVDRRGFS